MIRIVSENATKLGKIWTRCSVVKRGSEMYFNFGTRKIVEAVGVLLKSESCCNSMEYLRLLKLLYIADRESIRETGRPIVGTKTVAMDNGPLHSEVYDLVKEQHFDEPIWSEYIRKDGYKIGLKKDPGVLNLSRFEISKLDEVSERYRNISEWDIVEITHRFPEWARNHVEGTSEDIPLEHIIEAVERSEDAEEILLDAKSTNNLHRLLGVAI